MKKKILLGLTILAVLAPLCMAKPCDTYDPYAKNQGWAGKSSIYHAYLVEKDSCWHIIAGGAWGKLTFNNDTGKFVFNGHALECCTCYALIEYPKPQTTWPWPINTIATGSTDTDGELHLAGTYSFMQGDYIWLVLYNDIVSGSLSGWHPSEYLFEYDVL